MSCSTLLGRGAYVSWAWRGSPPCRCRRRVSRRTPSQIYCENLIDQFDEMLEEAARRPLVMSLVLHSFILGHPHRLRQPLHARQVEP